MKTSNSVVSNITNKTWNLHAVSPAFISYIVGRLKERDHVPEKTLPQIYNTVEFFSTPKTKLLLPFYGTHPPSGRLPDA
jgi:hypothetical protein